MKAEQIRKQHAPVFIELHMGRKYISDAVGQLQCKISRQQHTGRQHTAQQRIHPHCQNSPRHLTRPEKQHTQARKHQAYKNTGEQSDIEVGKQRKSQGDSVQPAFSVPHQPYQPQYHQRQQRHRIQPDDIPVIAQHIAAQGIANREHAQGKVIAAKRPLQEQGKKQAGAPDLQQKQHCHRFPQPCIRHQNCQQVQRTCRIIGRHGHKVRPQPGVPGVEQ